MKKRKARGREEAIRSGLETIARRVLRLLTRGRRRPAEIAVFLVKNRELRKLKKRFLGIEATFVDVLAFPEPPGFPHPDRRGRFLGHVYLNGALLKDLERLVFLLVHGILHLTGFSHEGIRDTMVMELKELSVCAKLRASGDIRRLSAI